MMFPQKCFNECSKDISTPCLTVFVNSVTIAGAWQSLWDCTSNVSPNKWWNLWSEFKKTTHEDVRRTLRVIKCQHEHDSMRAAVVARGDGAESLCNEFKSTRHNRISTLSKRKKDFVYLGITCTKRQDTFTLSGSVPHLQLHPHAVEFVRSHAEIDADRWNKLRRIVVVGKACEKGRFTRMWVLLRDIEVTFQYSSARAHLRALVLLRNVVVRWPRPTGPITALHPTLCVLATSLRTHNHAPHGFPEEDSAKRMNE